MIKCPELLPAPEGKTGKDWDKQSKDWAIIYHECRIRHNGLVDAIKEIDSQ